MFFNVTPESESYHHNTGKKNGSTSSPWWEDWGIPPPHPLPVLVTYSQLKTTQQYKKACSNSRNVRKNALKAR